MYIFLVFLVTSFCSASFPMITTIRQDAKSTFFHLLPAELVQEVEYRGLMNTLLNFPDCAQAMAYFEKLLQENPLIAQNDALVYALVDSFARRYSFIMIDLQQKITAPGALQWYKDKALINAINWRNLASAEALVDNGANVNAQVHGRCPLIVAAEKPSLIGIFNLFVNKGANVNARDYNGCTALFYAVVGINVEAVIKLLKLKADINARDIWRRTPLCGFIGACNNAAQEQFPRDRDEYIFKIKHILKLLLQAGADINARDIDGATPLKKAQENAHDMQASKPERDAFASITQFLVENGATY